MQFEINNLISGPIYALSGVGIVSADKATKVQDFITAWLQSWRSDWLLA